MSMANMTLEVHDGNFHSSTSKVRVTFFLGLSSCHYS